MRRAVAGVACAASLATTGAAAQQTGSILRDPRGQLSGRSLSPEDRGREVANGYAACLLMRRATGVQRALAQDTDERVDQALSRLADSECLLDGELRMPLPLMRGALYRALYLREFKRAAPAPAQPAAPATGGAGDASGTMRAFGDCVVSADAADARVLVMADPATPAERQALVALRPAFGACVSPTSQVRFTRSVLQAAIAESAYRAATHPVVNK